MVKIHRAPCFAYKALYLPVFRRISKFCRFLRYNLMTRKMYFGLLLININSKASLSKRSLKQPEEGCYSRVQSLI